MPYLSRNALSTSSRGETLRAERGPSFTVTSKLARNQEKNSGRVLTWGLCWRSIRVLLASSVLGLTGCAGYYYGESYGPTWGSLVTTKIDLTASSYDAADHLLLSAPWEMSIPIRVAALFDTEAPDKPSLFGSVVADQIATRWVQRGLRVIESGARDNSDVAAVSKPSGPYAITAIASAPSAPVALVGHYTVGPSSVFISLRLLQADGRTLKAFHQYSVPLNDDVRALLGLR